MVYLDPQETVWRNKSGQKFTLSKLQDKCPDALAPFRNIAGFNLGDPYYPKTLFRFPLRTTPSELSENIYSLDRLEELIDALRGEANLLLPFLRSVDTIEVHRISPEGCFSLIFKVEIASFHKPSLKSKRQRFLEELKAAHSKQSYGISNLLEFVADFHVEVTDYCVKNQSGSTHFLVVATVGSTSSTICEAAKKQKVFPWVGAALQLDTPLSNNGRIFCFLPMPLDVSSKLPVHVNGTFSLNDDRRSIKWPAEQGNDPAATSNWNGLLVSQLLPQCYVKLLLNAKCIDKLSPAKFYSAWPEVNVLQNTHWEQILVPLFSDIFKYPVLWSENTEALKEVGEWVAHTTAVFVPLTHKLPSVVHRVLSSYSLKLVSIPEKIWQALRASDIAVTEVSPRIARNKLSTNVTKYMSIDTVGKWELLRYCLEDKQYSELQGLSLLPLANGVFVPFQKYNPYSSSKVYLCNNDYPRYLLPNLDHMLVDVSDDQSLYNDLRDVTTSNQTQLALLTAYDVSQLLPKSMPSSLTLNDPCFNSSWFEKFWKWVGSKNLNWFEGQSLLPVGSNKIIRLKPKQAVVYIPHYNSCSPLLLSAFEKLGVMYSLQSRFPYLQHPSLSQYVNQFNTDGVLDSIYTASCYSNALLSPDESQALLSLFAQNTFNQTPQHQILTVLKSLPIFMSCSNSSCKLYSVTSVTTNSLLKKPIIEPANLGQVLSQLPSTIIIFSQNDHKQIALLNLIGVEHSSETNFLVNHIFPLIHHRAIDDGYIDPLMNEVHRISSLLIVKDSSFAFHLSQLAFVRTGPRLRQYPRGLFDPSNTLLKQLYEGENVFPTDPYNSSDWLQFLKHSCSLRTLVQPEEILSIISAIKFSSRSCPQPVSTTQLSRAKAILQYVSSANFQRQAIGSYKVPECGGNLPFQSALEYLASNYAWLPVLAECPSDYPSVLPWKGEGCESHFFTLDSKGAVMTSDNKGFLPYIAGSQVYLTDPADSPSVQCSANDSLCTHAIAHLELVTIHYQNIPPNQLSSTVDKVYSFMERQHKTQLNPLRSLEKWIYINKHGVFVNPSVVAINPNPSFRHDLEPYLYILPESLSSYRQLFTNFGVKEQITQSQIVGVLKQIKENIDKNETIATLTSSDIWSVIMSIFNWLTDSGTIKVKLSDGDKLYVPTESDSEWPQLKIATEVVYTNNDFLKNFLRSSSSDESYTFVHTRINAIMANCLGLTPLSDYLDITEDTFEDTGQHEPLTVRLKNILNEYKDGLTIAKELLQNADDAEATEVNFCYDARTHAVESSSLFFPKMLQSHGPALLVHNNKTFSTEDFENITKLAGATKQNKPLKIGKFGIGFCSVYHITDVPSFISQDILTIFDPTMNYLQKEIKNPSRPGKIVRYTSHFIKRSKQLVPYDGLFGFDPEQEYNGTLFRLPFRSAASELSGTCYTEDHHVKCLISEMTACSSNLILFLQHVKKITFQVIKNGESQPSVVLEISKTVLSLPSLPIDTALKQITSKTPLCPTVYSHWIVSSESAHVSNKHATASVAASLLPTSSGTYAINCANEGEVFCFLPLSQKTGLSVHVSGNFAVINNRRGIWTSDNITSSLSGEVHWNISLMESVIPIAYHRLLIALQNMHCHSVIKDYVFYSCWPLKDSLKSKNPWMTMIDTLYQNISTRKLFYSNNVAKWLYLNESKFLAIGILCQSTVSIETTDNGCISDVVEHLKLPIVHLPVSHHSYFQLTPYTISEKDFLNLFFENLDKFRAIKQSRDQLILRMLEVYATEYDDETERSYTFQRYFKDHACIPCAPDGSVLKKCNELIDPIASFAKLYDEIENRFPLKELTDRHLAHSSLLDLGMMHEKLPYKDVVERAQKVKDLHFQDRSKAQNQTKLILETMESNMLDPEEKEKSVLDSIPFLPVLSKPHNYPLSWAGYGHQLMCGSKLVVNSASRKYTSETNSVIAGSQVAFLNESSVDGCGELGLKCQSLLSVRTLPSCDEVVHHLRELILMFESQTVTVDIENWIDLTCQQIYRFLDDRGSDDSEVKCIQQLTKLSCIWNGKKFLNVHQVAKQWKLDGPYLHQVPTVVSICHNLCKALSLKDDFSKDDVKNALSRMKQDFGNQPVDENSQCLLKELVSHFLEIKPDEFSDYKVLLPDEKYVLVWSTDLAYNDAPWAPRDETYRYVNAIIPRVLARQLHVKPVRAKLLEKYDNPSSIFPGIEFGQREELTRRIQNILRDYPFDVTVLKELLQNADDAKATKMYVILDQRKHKTQSIISEEWQRLQGPALLVWNDSVFTEKNIKGIQGLGLGSKRCEADSIGQYGIGFNSVYHLTDCPSFVTNGDTMCIMDPHCTFVPGATPLNPGRRFDNLKSGFWDDFEDVKSAYLRSNLDNLPDEVLGGSLFRLPLRSTHDLVKSSKIAADLSGDTLVTSLKMEQFLHNWAPKMKAAMFFLNNMRELRFFVIQENAKVVKTQYHYFIDVSPSTQEICHHFRQKLSSFSQQRGCESCVIMYPLSVVEIDHSSYRDTKYKEEWIIQQGVGDIEKRNQMWTFVKHVKPRHGIAAPLNISHTSLDYQSGVTCPKLDGQVFCFLPLPIYSHLPVHINGHFILNSTRRQLWQTSNPGEEDGKSIWNKNLLSAIASSYGNFLENAHQYYVDEGYSKLSTLYRDVENYYSALPEADTDSLDEMWLAFAKECYSKVCKSNCSVLAVVKQVKPPQIEEGNESQFIVSWDPIRSAISSSQVYFWCETFEKKEVIQPVLEAIGMKLTLAPFKLRKYLNNAVYEESNKCPAISPRTVYAYYSQFFCQITSDQFPCDISSTSFKSVESFKIFTRYVLQRLTESNLEILEFPSPPFDSPLLLTADGKLRKFDQHNKVIFSHFANSGLFPNSMASFVHPALLDIEYSKEYFLSGSSDYGLIHRILADNLPQCLCDANRCDNAKSLYPIKKLQQLWLCFSHDPVFNNHLTSILNRWALILTTDDRFFSTACNLHPILPLTDGDMENLRTFQVLTQIGMPVIDTSVVFPSTGPGIQISEPTKVLNSLFYLAQDTDLSLSLSNGDIGILIGYLSSINYRIERGSCHQVKRLPLFESVVGDFMSLSGLQVFLWPIDCTCMIGYKKWIRGHSLVFLKSNASWSRLCSPDELRIQRIKTEELYIKYIFSHFHLMSESERYEHLLYIRDELYDINNIKLMHMHHDSPVVRQRAATASSFMSSLKRLRCIGKDGHRFLQVSDFCDHEQKIFTTFSRHFRFLPEYFTSNQLETSQWMKFFRGLGLKTTIAHEKFIKFCTETAAGQVADVREASSVLIESLFKSKQEWHGHPQFLARVSRIGFLCSEKLPSLTWIKSTAQTSKRIQLNDNEHIDMTEPSNAAVLNFSTILWTVKPIVSLPREQRLLKQLSVCTEPSKSNVIKNLHNICAQSQYADICLFDKYYSHLRPPVDGKSLSNVFLEHFEFLQTKGLSISDTELKTLQNIPCIPVHASPDSLVTSDMVLVIPQIVLTGKSAVEYHPFLHQLPQKFHYLYNLLKGIGVTNSLDLKHMQVVLESAYKCTEGKEMDPNTNQCVLKALRFIYKALTELNDDNRKEQLLLPLYLPSKKGTLVLSTNLLYHDEPYFDGKSLDLGETQYTEVDITYSKYEFYPSQFCNLLPLSLRPKGISKLCNVQVAPECRQCDLSDIAKKLSSTLNLSVLPKAVVIAVKHNIKASKYKKAIKEEELQLQMDSFLKNINVVSCSNLELVILLKETKTTIGKVKVSFFLEKNEPGYTLYLDTALNGTLVLHMFSELADLLLTFVQQVCSSVVPLSIKKTFEYFLMAESADDLTQELQRMCLPISADVTESENVTLRIGMDIPQDWHYRLDQDINNLFHANEYVGYKDEEGHIILGKIVNAIASEDDHTDSACQYNKRYLVFTSEEDETGTKVSVLSLYKFTKGARKDVTHSVVAIAGNENASSMKDDSSLD